MNIFKLLHAVDTFLKKRKTNNFSWLIFLFFFSINTQHVLAADSESVLPAVNLLFMSSDTCTINRNYNDDKFDLSHEGLSYYAAPKSHKKYSLEQLKDRDFNRLSKTEKLLVADKLLSSLFFGYRPDKLESMIDSGDFLCLVRSGLAARKNDIGKIENYILNDTYFIHHKYYENEVNDILARFYAMEYLDEYFLHNWIAYILTQTIMFSPAYELDSSHMPDVANVYNMLVMDMEDDISMRYSSYLHMTSLENWRRFRSPEDNGREMLEIFAFDFNDAHVPLSATTLQNWYLDEDHDTLVIGLNQNHTPISLFGTTIINGFDFYRELVKSKDFQKGVTRRLVDFFFTQTSKTDKEDIVGKIVSSNPERWQDILLQILFSKEYLLQTEREKSAEELFYSLAKKMPYKHQRYTFDRFNDELNLMNQASMKYKLGKLERTPLDSLSFARYHKYIRERILLDHVCGDGLNGYEDWKNDGWTPELIDAKYFSLIEDNPMASMNSFIDHLFMHFIQRQPTASERNLFLDNMLRNNRSQYHGSYNLLKQDDKGCYYGRKGAARGILDYLSRLSEFYWFEGVQ